MSITIILKKCQDFYKLATSNISEIYIDESGMRPDSFELVRQQRKSNLKMRPIIIEVYPDSKPFLADGRHRLSVAKENGDKTIDAIVRYYDDGANIINEEQVTLTIN